MTPRRMVEDPSVSKELRSLLERAPAYEPLDRASFERGRSRVAGTAAASGALAALFTLKWLGIALAATAVAVSSGVAIVKRAAPEQQPRVVETRASRPVTTPSVVKSTFVPAPVLTPSSAPTVSGETPRATIKRRAAAPSPDALVPELERLNEAKLAVKAEPERALTLLDRYRNEFPKGQLRLESLVLRVEALSRLGRQDEAHALAKRVEGSSGGDLYSERLKGALGQIE